MRSSRKRLLLPLLHALLRTPEDCRVILLSHLDDKTRDGIYEAIACTLTSSHVPLRKRLFLKSKLSNFKREFKVLASPKATPRQKKTSLCMVGAGPMRHLMRAAIPLLINTSIIAKGRVKKYQRE